jgi:hypothetical protein
MAMDMDTQGHWENIYGKKAPDAVGIVRTLRGRLIS